MPLSRRAGTPSNTIGLGRGLLPYQVACSSIQPFGHNRHEPKIGWGGCAFFLRVAGSPCKTMSRETYLCTKWHLDPWSRLATIDVGRKLGAPPLLGRRLVPHLIHKVAWAEAYLHAKCHFDPCSRLATINMGRKFGGSAPFLGR